MQHKVILIGGSPMSGKSTISRKIAGRLGYPCLSTDDVGIVIKELTTRESHPELHFMSDWDHSDYYSCQKPQELISDMRAAHERVWPGLKKLVENHISWAGPMVLEGYGLYPEPVSTIATDMLKSLWLLPDEEVFEQRYEEDPFWRGAKDPEAMKRNFLARTQWHHALIMESAIRLQMPVVRISTDTSIESVVEQALSVLGDL